MQHWFQSYCPPVFLLITMAPIALMEDTDRAFQDPQEQIILFLINDDVVILTHISLDMFN